MRRRNFISLLATAAAFPFTARAQPMPMIGFLGSGFLSASDGSGERTQSMRFGPVSMKWAMSKVRTLESNFVLPRTVPNGCRDWWPI